MPRKSDGEKIDELMLLVAALDERLDNTRTELRELKRDLDEGRRW